MNGSHAFSSSPQSGRIGTLAVPLFVVGAAAQILISPFLRAASPEFATLLPPATPPLYAPATYVPAPGTFAFATFTAEWTDPARNRPVPVRIYHPTIPTGAANGTQSVAPFPVIIFSHGLCGTRDGYRYLGEYWAAHGFVVVHPQHIGSDDAVWKGSDRPMRSMGAAAADPANFTNRPLDIRFVIDRLTALNADPSFPLRGRLDLTRIGVGGHSFGAYTTMAIAGETFPRSPTPSFVDPRVKAAIAMSTPVKGAAAPKGGGAFGSVAIPVFHLTGTRDSEPFGTSDPTLRRVPFDEAHLADTYLLTFADGDHMVFSGQRLLGGVATNDAEFHRLIQESTTAFWNAYLKGDASARTWLDSGGLKSDLGSLGVFEQKHPTTGP